MAVLLRCVNGSNIVANVRISLPFSFSLMMSARTCEIRASKVAAKCLLLSTQCDILSTHTNNKRNNELRVLNFKPHFPRRTKQIIIVTVKNKKLNYLGSTSVPAK